MHSIPPNRQRIASIDILRGIVMVIMALDHTRDFFHAAAMTGDPTNPTTTTPALFFTRWITHFCAPVFVLLSGTAAYLNGRKKTIPQLSRFLFTRGCWFILVEIVIMNLILTFNPLYNLVILNIIWAIGISMVCLSLLIHLPYRLLLAIGLLIFFGHNGLDYVEQSSMNGPGFFLSLLHGRSAVLPLGDTHIVLIAYSFLPWTGLMILGYCMGKLFTAETAVASRRKALLSMGAAFIMLFVILRSINLYGNPFPWSAQKNGIYTLLSFMNANKYPPSLIFCCMTLGPALIVLALVEPVQNKLTAFFSVYGRVPFFYFVLHFLLLHLVCVVCFFASGYGISEAFNPQSPLGFRPPQFGYPLSIVYMIWIAVVLSLYPFCRRYDQYKRTHTQWWLGYL